MNKFKLGITLGLREWRTGKLTLILFALILAITAFTAQTILSNRLQQTLMTQAAKSLGGDLVISSSRPIPTEWQSKAHSLNLNTQEIVLFQTMLYASNKLQLVNIEANTQPELNTIWVDSRLKNISHAKIGVAEFSVSKHLTQDWENITGLLFGPRVMMNINNIAKTQTILPGSRVEYRLLLSGSTVNINQFRQWLIPYLTPTQQLLDTHNQRFIGSELLKRTNQFLSLAIIICLVISFTALLLSMQHYLIEQKIIGEKLYRLGLPKPVFKKILFYQFMLIFFIACILGTLLGYTLQYLFASYLPITLAPLSLNNLHFTISMGFISLIMGIMGVFYFVTRLLFYFLHIISPFTKNIWRQGLFNLLRHKTYAIIQIISFSLVITAIVLLYQIRSDLILSWETSLPTHAPNYFAFNIDPMDKDHFQKITHSTIYPMTRGRLIALNHSPIFSAVPAAAQSNNALHRELNLSYLWQLPSDNQIIEGKFWNRTDINKPWISIESKLANDLGIKINDELTFQIGDQQVSGTVKNIRTLDWNSFHPNFYIIFPPGVLDNFPTTYITSFYLSDNQKDLLDIINQQFPNVTLIDVSTILKQIKTLLAQATTALQYTYILALLAGILLLITTLTISFKERQKTYRLFRILGANKKFIQGCIGVEFGIIGFLTASMGLFCATLLSWGAAHFWLNITYHFTFESVLWSYGLAFICFTLPVIYFSSSISPSRPKAV